MDWTDQESRGMNRHCMVVEFYHKPTKFMPNGAYVKYIPGCILEINTEKYPYDHKKLPVIFDTDIDVDGEITGRPFTANIERLQRLHDMVTASMAKGYAIASSPKLVYPKGAIDPNQFTNGYAAIEYAGPVAPQLVTYNGIPNASLDFRAVLEKDIEKQSSVYGISRGEPPKGIKVATSFATNCIWPDWSAW